ncbi:93208a1d-74a7-4e40-b736-4410499b780b [Thermothielavioides terrestris]
MYCD